MLAFEKRILLEYYPENSSAFANAAARLEAGEPLAYIVGEQYFYGERYKLNSDCLIPRPDTECIVERLTGLLPKGTRFADFCTGSGCIAISTLCHTEGTTALAVDISVGALAMARENAALNRVADRIEFLQADLLSPEFDPGCRFDAVVSNPPYIRSGVIPTLDVSVRDHEPLRALDGGDDGMIFYRMLICRFDDFVVEGGVMLLEIGYDQREQIERLCANAGLTVSIERDYGGNDRAAIVTRK